MGISETDQPQIIQVEGCATKNQHEFEEVSTELKLVKRLASPKRGKQVKTMATSLCH